MVLNTPRNTCHYVVPGTETFRLASKAWLATYGTNLQNIEKEARRIYVPDDGKIFVQRDQSGAEALIVAYLCNHGLFRDLFLNNIKPHVFVGLHLFKDKWQDKLSKEGLDIKFDIETFVRSEIKNLTSLPFWHDLDKLIKSSDNWPAQERYYYIAKQVCHSSNYDIRPQTFRMNVLEKSKGKIVLSKQQAEYFISFYHELFPEIHEWHREVQRQLESTRYLYSLQGFPRYFSREFNESYLKKAYAFIPQSTVGLITNIAYTRLQKFIAENHLDWDLLANTHDSYLVQCPIGEELECNKMMGYFMNQELTSPRGEKFSMKSEGACGFNWAPYKPNKNEQGLREIKE